MDGNVNIILPSSKTNNRSKICSYLRHLLTIALRVQWSLGQQHWMLLQDKLYPCQIQIVQFGNIGKHLGCNSELVEERVMPDFLHIVPIRDNAMLDGIPKAKDATFGLRLIPNVRILSSREDLIGRTEILPC